MTTTTTANNNKKNGNKKFKFEIGEKVLCYQDKHIYEAKCLDIRKSNTLIEYLIHYRGWKPKYDEWVLADRILKYTQDNLKLQQKLRQFKKSRRKRKSKKSDHDDDELKKKKSTKKDDSSKKLANSSDGNSTNNNNNSVNHNYKNLNSNDIEIPVHIENQQDFLNKREVKIRIPEDLKTILTDDWELIINQKKLVHLPFKLNIDKILNDYFFNKSQAAKLPSNHTLDGYIDFLNAIRRYFNFFLDKCLLYPSEKQQMEYLIKNYDEFAKTAKSISTNNKDSKRLQKKFKKATSKSGNNRFVLSSNLLTNENENTPTIKSPRLPLLFTDQNSQSETSDSCSTSTEVSSTELQNCQQNKLDPSNTTSVIINNNEKPIDFTKLYGAVHLLRLFTKLGQFIFYTDLNSERINLVNSYIYDFLKYLSKNLWLFANESDTSYIDSILLCK
ncbi:mortality factor 4-like protein 1 [Dermatophagoides pteronyssinus]|uniref:mortality factor 4-like protein 1 n=1 Tax=Dermatophagoides pteronyssinus TaxID=6956 RepID=UPI003F66C2A5